jgi:hypothetical protein
VIEPVPDSFFSLAPGTGALVVGWPEVADGLREAGLEIAVADDLSDDALAAVDVVAIAPDGDAVPPAAMKILAARRVLVTGPVATTYGLFPGIDFMHTAAADAAVELTRTALTYPDAFVTVRVLGALAAERHRG